MNDNTKLENIMYAVSFIGLLIIILIGVSGIRETYEPNQPEIVEDPGLTIIKVYKDSELVAQVAAVPDRPVSFGNYKVVFYKRK